MHESHLLESFLYFLLAAVVAVPLFRRLKMGAILGYLCAGIIIGPQLLSIISHPESVLHFAEIGVVLLLFLIGLELNPDKLWQMRSQIAFLGGGQLLISATLIVLALMIFAMPWQSAVVVGLALALSSTAFAIQLMAEKGILASADGRRGFAVLLMQDLAVIPILLLTQTLAGGSAESGVPWWYGVLALIFLLLCGRFLLNPLLSIVVRYGSRETMTATALFIVVGAAFLMDMAGLSMGLGAFVAGIMLANSHFRQQLETDIEPFKGLTLGLFFIAIGMSLNIGLLLQEPLFIIGMALLLMLGKALVISLMVCQRGVNFRSGFQLGLMLSQGGEFAFVIMAQATALLSSEITETVNLIVGISMALTAPLVAGSEIFFKKFPEKNNQNTAPDELPEIEQEAEILILGFGRFAQITARILSANRIPFVSLDNNLSHIEFIKQFGHKIHFGDVTRLDLLEVAGIEKVHTVFITIQDTEQVIEIIETIRRYYPDKVIISRSKSRQDYLKIKKAGADKVIRELFTGSIEAAADVLTSLGFTTSEAISTTEIFRQHDEQLLQETEDYMDDTERLKERVAEGRRELEQLFNQDKSIS